MKNTKELIVAFIAAVVLLTIYYLLKRIIKKHFKKNTRREKTLVSIFTNIIRYTFILISLSFILNAFGIDTRAIVASLGIAGLVIGLSLQDIIKDFVAGLFIILEKQFAVGDQITVSGFRGEVVRFGLKTTKIKAFNGEVQIIPNRLADTAINHSLENPVLYITFTIPINYNVVLAREILEKSCVKLSKTLNNIKSEVELLGVNDVTHFATEFLIKVETKRNKNFQIRREILYEVGKAMLNNKEKLLE